MSGSWAEVDKVPLLRPNKEPSNGGSNGDLPGVAAIDISPSDAEAPQGASLGFSTVQILGASVIFLASLTCVGLALSKQALH